MRNPESKNQAPVMVFSLDELRYALYLSAIERVICAVEITPLPKAPDHVLGVINLHGRIVPVIDIRKRLRLPPCEIVPENQFILAHTTRRLVALVVDSVVGIHHLADRDLISKELVLPGMAYIHGLVKLNNELVLICDLDQFLSLDEAQKLDGMVAEISSSLKGITHDKKREKEK